MIFFSRWGSRAVLCLRLISPCFILKKKTVSSQGLLTVKIRLKVSSNYREVTVEDTGSVILEENVCLLGGKEGSWKFCRCFVIRVKPDGCLAVCLRARARVRACLCVWSFPGNPCVCMCACLYMSVLSCVYLCLVKQGA